MKSLTDKNALVVGGGSGMGAAIALLLEQAGARVAIAGRSPDKLQDVASKGSAIEWQVADVAVRQSIDSLFSWFDDQFGSLDIMINAAGINVPDRAMTDIAPETWDTVLKINLTGAFDCLRFALDRMRAQKDGLVVMINSVSGKRSNPLGGVAYNASKFGMTALGSCVAEEERDAGIRITNVFPGEVNTPILDKRPVPPSPGHREGILQPEDVAKAVLMLAELPPRAHVPELVIKPTNQSYL